MVLPLARGGYTSITRELQQQAEEDQGKKDCCSTQLETLAKTAWEIP